MFVQYAEAKLVDLALKDHIESRTFEAKIQPTDAGEERCNSVSLALAGSQSVRGTL